MSKKVIITGIPGSGSTDFCSRYSALDSLKVRTYNMGDRLLETAQESPQKPFITAENLLNLHPEFLCALRDRSFDRTLLMMKLDQRIYNRFLFDMHCQFFWNDVLTNAYDWRYLTQISADMFITIIDKPSIIKERQMATNPGQLQDHDFRDLLLWQNTEANITSGWAANLCRPAYVLPSQQDPIIIESLLENAFLIYFQMPMTDASSEADAMITAFKERLLAVGQELTGRPTPLIDPRTIDIETGEGLSQKEERAIRIHTVHRDLNWYIPQASDLVAYYPPGTMLSKGVSDESTRGFETGKNAFVIFSNENTSPFMDISTRVFTSEEEFFDFFPEYMENRLETLQRV
ncbi:MAG: hypothetical protein Q7K65_05550 [Candidatus Buchananbacteria bacterium]|nr:hypothetical protein [Candidatus Buchananbacteria bacterium]